MAVTFPTGFNVVNADPIDSRIVVANQAGRLGFSSVNVYEGLVVYQKDNDSLYVLTDTSKWNLNDGWTLVGPVTAIIAGTNISASSTTGSVTLALSSSVSISDITASYVTGGTAIFNSLTGTYINSDLLSGSSLIISASTISASNYIGLPSGLTVGGSDTQIQFNSGSTFSGSSNLIYNYTTNTLSGTTARFNIVTGSNITGSNAEITYLTASVISASSYLGISTTTSAGGADKQIQFNSGSVFSGSANLTFDYDTSILSGTTTQFSTITGSSVSSSNYIGDGANIINLTSSNINNFTNDVRAQFSAGNNIQINNGAISASITVAGGSDTQIQFNSGSSFSGSSNLTYDYSSNILSGTTAQFNTITGSTITGSLVRTTELTASTISASSYLGINTNAAGADTQIQFNSGSAFNGSSNLTYDYSIGQMTLTGTLVVSGTLYANEYHTNIISSSIIYSSGSTKFGDDASDVHEFTGSIYAGVISGTTAQFTSLTGSGSSITDLTASNISNFTNDVRAQISAGTGIQINAGVISASNIPNSSLQNSAVSIGNTVFSLGSTGSTIQGLSELTSSFISGATSVFTTLTSSNITGTTIQVDTVTSSYSSVGTLSVTSGIIVDNSSFSFGYTKVTTNYQMTTASCIVGVSASSALTLTLPSASQVSSGRYFIIKDEAGNSATNNIIISCSLGSGDTIDNISSSVISVNNGSYTIYRGESNKYYIV
jgi:hypothetical protein